MTSMTQKAKNIPEPSGYNPNHKHIVHKGTIASGLNYAAISSRRLFVK